MQFKVPQDVQREDTIIGPITFRQLIILSIGGGIAYAIYISLSIKYFWEIWLPPSLFVLLLTLAFAFLRINELPFHLYLLNLFEHLLLSKKRIWKQGSGDTFISPYEKIYKEPKKEIEKIKPNKIRNLEELTKILDNYGQPK